MFFTLTPRGRCLPVSLLLALLCSLFVPAALMAADGAVGAVVRIENMTKVPGSNRSFPADDFFTFHRILNPVNSRGVTLLSTERNQMRIHNDGATTLVITKLTSTNTAHFKISGLSIPSGGLKVEPGKYVTATVTFVTAEGTAKRLITEYLVMDSNADNSSRVKVTFRGAYMTRPEGSNEINAQQVFQAFGLQTEMGKDQYGKYIVRPSSNYPKEEDVNGGKHGDMVLSKWFVQADPSKPIRAFQLAAFHGPEGASTELLGDRNVLQGGMTFSHPVRYHQSLLARATDNATDLAGKYAAKTDQHFKITIAGYKTTGGTPNGSLKDDILGVRVYRVIDQNGRVVPNEYIALMDYIGTGCGQGSHNCDWNDNAIYIINARPEAVPRALGISDLTVEVGTPRDYSVEAGFDRGFAGNDFTYTAARVGGGSIPSWIQLNRETGTFTVNAPSSSQGSQYAIRVTAKDYNGLQASSDFTIKVNGTATNAAPVAVASANPLRGTAPLKVTLDGSASKDPDGSIANYAWTWSGGSATGAKTDIVLPAGTYDVTLTVRDNLGKTAKDVVRIQVDSQTDPPTEGYWLEAECAAVGSNWSTVSGTGASEGKYVVSSRNSVSSPPSDVAANRVRFTLNNVKQGTYYLFARLKAPDTSSDSYWVRVNGGAWFAWNRNIAGKDQFEWNLYSGSSFPTLKEGTNIIDFAYREAGTRLDKLLISPNDTYPVGLGDAAGNCGTAANQPPVARATVSKSSGVAPLTVTLDGSGSSDADGTITSYKWSWPGGTKTGKQATVTLAEGSYAITLTVTDDDGAGASATVKVEVSADPGTDPPADGDLWLEAECAQVGASWTVKTDAAAANGKYVVREKGSSTSAPPSDIADNRVRFPFTTATAGTYRLFARVLAGSVYDDSFYVRINGGSWYAWNRRLWGSDQFVWKEYEEGLLDLKAGSNTIDFAYREDGTKLDKLYLTRSTNTPGGMGGTDESCGGPGDTTTEAWLETECGDLASGWSTVSSAAASNGSYIVYTGPRNLNVPGDAETDRKAYFPVEVTTAGKYHLFLRVDAPSDDDNSVWVRVDEGAWLKMWKAVGGEKMLTNGFEWYKVNNDGRDVVFDLSPGKHTITLANRESGTMLDKLRLSLASSLPTGEGGTAPNCSAASATQLSATLMPTASVSEIKPALRVFPNPTLAELTVNYEASQEGIIDLEVYDVNGRVVKSLRREKSGQVLSIRIPVYDLSAGMYHLRVRGEGRPLMIPFVKQ